MPLTRLRWVALSVFVVASCLNYLDRQILATLAPLISAEFHLSNEDYGYVLAAFSIVYTVAAPVAGWFIDRAGLNRGISFSVALWSLAGMLTGAVSSLTGLLFTRSALGLAESGGVPATGKALRLYLLPRERAFGNAISQLGLSVGAMIAPFAATGLAMRYGWRSAFVITGLVGFLWIPLWRWTARRIPPVDDGSSTGARSPLGVLLADRRLWGLIAANVLGMTCYTLWTNWTTIFLVREHHPDAGPGGLAGLDPAAGLQPGRTHRRMALLAHDCRWAGGESGTPPHLLRGRRGAARNNSCPRRGKPRNGHRLYLHERFLFIGLQCESVLDSAGCVPGWERRFRRLLLDGGLWRDADCFLATSRQVDRFVRLPAGLFDRRNTASGRGADLTHDSRQ